jgi:hypothetical protein
MRPNCHDPSNGWRFPSGLVYYYDNVHELSAEDSAMLSALMNVPRQDQLEFVHANPQLLAT